MRSSIIKQSTKLAVSALAFAVLAGCGSSSSSSNKMEATISYTKHNVPHIKADNYKGLGYGIGYAQAQENLCTLSEQIMRINGEKSKYYGPGEGMINFATDVGYKAINHPERAERLFSQTSQTTQDLLNGYAEGFNRVLDEKGSPANYPTPCANAPWVHKITAQDILAYHLDLATLAGSRNFLTAIAAATPPKAEQTALSAVPLDADRIMKVEGIGSNGWALGQNRVSEGKAMLLGNPHFPWEGELRFYEQHLEIPGKMNVHGVGMVGLPAVVIGFNQNVGWTHTVSLSKRFTFYQLELNPENPLQYKYDGEYRDIEKKTIKVEVNAGEKGIIEQKHTVYFSHFGPIVGLGSLSSALDWTNKSAIAVRDANLDNINMLDQWIAMDEAQSREEFFEAFATHQALPWVNTMMIADDGTANYIDGTQVPQFNAVTEQYWRNMSKLTQLNAIWQDGAGNILLPGNSSSYEWKDTGDARAPGLVPFSKAPQQTRKDYVYNANSSHWLTNVDEPLEGYSIVYGGERSVRSPRTRYNAQLISNPAAHGLTGADNKFNLKQLKDVLDHNGSLFGDDKQFMADLVQRCNDGVGTVANLEAAMCEALDNWDGQYNLNSQGAQLMREFLSFYRDGGHRTLSNDLFANSFNPAAAATTPSGLNPAGSGDASDPVLANLVKAAQRLTANGIAIDAKLGDIQHVIKAEGHEPIAITGGYSYEGLFNVIESSFGRRDSSAIANTVVGEKLPGSVLSKVEENNAAYHINYGSSIVLALVMTDKGPKADMFLTYGQSHDPKSEFFEDQTKLFSNLEWRPMETSTKNAVSIKTISNKD